MVCVAANKHAKIGLSVKGPMLDKGLARQFVFTLARSKGSHGFPVTTILSSEHRCGMEKRLGLVELGGRTVYLNRMHMFERQL